MDGLSYITEKMFRPDVIAEVAGQPRLVGSKCARCADIRFPAAHACPSCHAAGEDLVPVILSDEGVVTTCCRIDRAPKAFKAPYLVGYVQLPEGPRILCQLDSAVLEPKDVIGKRCKLEVAALFIRDDEDVLGYKFRIVP